MMISVIVSRFDLKLDPPYNPQKWYEDMTRGDYFMTAKGPLPGSFRLGLVSLKRHCEVIVNTR